MLKNPTGVMRFTFYRLVLLLLAAAVPMSIALGGEPRQQGLLPHAAVGQVGVALSHGGC
jgi:hypothetical protein